MIVCKECEQKPEFINKLQCLVLLLGIRQCDVCGKIGNGSEMALLDMDPELELFIRRKKI